MLHFSFSNIFFTKVWAEKMQLAQKLNTSEERSCINKEKERVLIGFSYVLSTQHSLGSEIWTGSQR